MFRRYRASLEVSTSSHVYLLSDRLQTRSAQWIRNRGAASRRNKPKYKLRKMVSMRIGITMSTQECENGASILRVVHGCDIRSSERSNRSSSRRYGGNGGRHRDDRTSGIAEEDDLNEGADQRSGNWRSLVSLRVRIEPREEELTIGEHGEDTVPGLRSPALPTPYRRASQSTCARESAKHF